MANPNRAAVAAIQAAATKYGLDPAAMIAVARVESGLNPKAVGDGGHAFGLFQFNNAGGVITGQKNPERYLNPNFNAMEAARHIASIPGAKGAKGKNAIALIVNSFERPADKAGEIAKANSYYSVSPETVGRAAAYSNIIGNVSTGSQTAPKASSASGQGNLSTQSYDPAQALTGYLINQSTQGPGNHDSTGELLNVLNQSAAAEQATANVTGAKTKGTIPSSTTLTTTTSTSDPSTLPSPVVGKGDKYKLIGTPYQGTHKLYGNWESDNAIDIAVPARTPVYATENGTISDRIGSLNSKDPHMAGLRVNLTGKDNNFYYQHLQSLTVKAGQKVKKGDLLGYSGALNHVHFAVEKGDPRNYYK